MEILSLALTVIGLGISGVALVKANNAKQAVAKALGYRNTQDDLARLKALISAMIDAKEAVAPWVAGMPQEQTQGRNRAEDLAQLNRAVDQLRTKSPIGADDNLRKRISKSANLLDKQFRAIADGESNEDHWKPALSEIQLMIPRLEQAEREMRDSQIMNG